MRGMSMRRRVGFVGDSIQTSLVLCRNAARMVSSSAPSRSTKVVSDPWLTAATRVMYLNVPP